METTSPKKSLNWMDVLSLLKNVAIFFIPIVLANIVPIQNWIIDISGLNPEIIAITLSAIVKMIEYRYRNNQQTVAL